MSLRKRDYKKERQAYYGYGRFEDVTPTQQKHRKEKNNRNKARTRLKKEGIKLKPNHDVDHKDGNALNNSRSNLRVQHRSKNRSVH